MIRFIIALNLSLFLSLMSYGQECNCVENFEWVKKTFEENDAGFEYSVKIKGQQAYEEHNEIVLAKVKSVDNLNECRAILFEWLQFFRSGHIAIRLKDQPQRMKSESDNSKQFPDWETFSINTEEFKKYLDSKENHDHEGIWEIGSYTVGVIKQNDEYVGFIVEAEADSWTEGQVKFRFSIENENIRSTYYLRDHSPVESDNVLLIGKNHMQIGRFHLTRLYPKLKTESKFASYMRMLNADSPYIEQLNERTVYFRIPSFQHSQKQAIDSVITRNKSAILNTENLIIDIRNGTGGSYTSYQELLPFIYTNPIRTIGVEYLSTKLNNQRMLDFIEDPENAFDDDFKIWAKEGYDKLEEKLGEFVNIEDETVSISEYDTIYSNPKNIGIIINNQNGSSDEQFLIAAKQSKKVKLFGTSTMGVLDISNTYFVSSPCNDFELGYCLSRSMRIPDFSIDGIGIQPDYFIDKSIKAYDWTEYVNEILNE